MTGEPLGLDTELWPPDDMAADGRGWSFAHLKGIQVQQNILFRKLDELVRADPPSAPVSFGVDREIRFVEHHDYKPGIPVPLGMSYLRRPHRWVFFAEVAPILDATPTTPLGGVEGSASESTSAGRKRVPNIR